MNMSLDYYQILGIRPDAPLKLINSAHKAMLNEYHPDKNPSNREEATKRSALINEARDVLCNPSKKALYDSNRVVKNSGSEFSAKERAEAQEAKRRAEADGAGLELPEDRARDLERAAGPADLRDAVGAHGGRAGLPRGLPRRDDPPSSVSPGDPAQPRRVFSNPPAIGAALAWAAPTLELLVAARVLQGLGAAGPRIVSLALIRDIYSGRQMARIMSFVMVMLSLWVKASYAYSLLITL